MDKSIGDESKVHLPRQEEGEMGRDFQLVRFSFFFGGGAWGDDKNVLKLDYADSCLTANILTLMGLHTYDM